MPKRLTIAMYPAEDILSSVGEKTEMEIKVDGKVYLVKLGSLRLRTFKENDTCVCCGRVGTVMGLDLPIGSPRPHFNLYHKDKKGKRTLMTKDHIIPKSRGGKNHISNMQTMCCDCNLKKADKTPEEYAEYFKKRKMLNNTIVYVE